MSKRESIQRQRLEQLESEFRLLLPRILQQCADGRWGLFGQNDHLAEHKYVHWPEAEQLKDLAREIHSIRQGFGEVSPVVERFLHFCSLRGANVPGEPKLAQSLLDEAL